ncbi:MAG: Gldg family protein [Bacteroidales bacterium]|nr:Gldg family protein [Bacteroidales bacterium]
MKNKRRITLQLLMILGVVILINIVSDRFFVRVDLTQDQRYTLSDATRNILRDLKQPVTVSAYFTSDLPPQYINLRREFTDLLVEYGNLSRGMVVFEMIDPNDEETEMAAMQAGVQPVIVNVRERDQVKQQKAYMGAVVRMGDRKEAIPLIQSDAAMEYSLSTSIKKISIVDKPLIGVVQGHGQPPLSSLQQALSGLLVLNNVEEVNFYDTIEDISRFQSLMIIGPTDSIPSLHFSLLDSYLAGGGNLLVALNRVSADFNTLQGFAVETGLENWLMDKGVIVEGRFIVDANCGTVGVTQQTGAFQYTTNIRFPYLPLINDFADHPITKGLSNIVLQFASPILYTGDTLVRFEPIAFTSEKSDARSVPLMFDIQKQWTDRDFTRSKLAVAATLQGPISGNLPSRMVVFGDADFAVASDPRQNLQRENVSLLVNAVDWLSDDTGLVELRTKGPKARPLDEVEDGRKLFLKLLNFLLPIILIIIYGVYRIIRNRNIRMKRMEDVYV